MVIEEQIRVLKKRFRLAMNGVVSTDMRRRGVEYGLNFGVSLPTIRKIAEGIPRDLLLADALWREKVRECRIVATLIVPHEQFTYDLLEKWLSDSFTAELAEQLSHNLMPCLSFAHSWACNHVDSPRKEVSRLAFLSLGRVLSFEPLSPDCQMLLLRSGIASIQRSSSMLNPVLSAWEKQLVDGCPNFGQELKNALAEADSEERLTEYLLDYFE